MSIDKEVRYRVNIDDADFQAKLSQMRASLDMTMGGMNGAGYGGGMGFSPSTMLGGLGTLQAPGSAMMMGGLADFGTQIKPVTYTPPAIAMQPHFGMVQVQQTMLQAGLGTFGPFGIGAIPMAQRLAANPLNALNPGTYFNTTDVLPPQISYGEYTALSARGFGARVGDAAATGALMTGSTLASLATGGVGTMAGASLFSSGMGKLAGGFLGGALGGMAVSAYADQVVDMMAENRAVQTQLASGSFRFITGGADSDPLTGRGFNRASRQDAANFVQGLELKDVRFGMPEMRQILEAGMQTDMFAGTQNVQDFKDKFKGMVDAVKTITATLHSSLQEGLEVMRGFRDMGVTDPGQMTQLSLGSELRGRMSGRTGMEMMAIGQTGAEIFRGTGIAMNRGFELNQQNAVLVREMLNQGTLTRETIAQAGGENSLAQQMTAGTLASFQTAMGRGAMMANFDPATNGFKTNFLSNMTGKDAMGLIGNAAALANNPLNLFKFQAHQAEMISSLTPTQMMAFGLETDMAMARTMNATMGGNKDTLLDVLQSNMLREGKSQMQVDTTMAFLKSDPQKMEQDQMNAVSSMRNQAAMEDFRNRFGGKQITNFLRETFVRPVQLPLTAFAGDVEQSITNLGVTLMGGNATSATNLLTRSAVDHGEAALKSGRVGGTLVDSRGSLYQRVVGGASGDKLAETIAQFGTQEGNTITFQGGSAQLFGTKDEAEQFAKTHGGGQIIGTKDGKLMVMSSGELRTMTNAMRDLQPSQQARDQVAKEKVDDDMRAQLLDASHKAGKGGLSLDDVRRTMFGNKQLGDLTDVDKARLERELNTDSSFLGKAQKELQGRTGTFMSADLADKSRSQLLDIARVHQASAEITLAGGFFSGRHTRNVLEGVSPDAFSALADLAEGGGSKAEIHARDILKASHVSDKDMDGLLDKVKGLQGEARQKFIDEVRKKDAAVAQANEGANAASGGSSADLSTGANIGNITKDTAQQINNLMEANKKTLELIQRMQREIGMDLTAKGH